MGAGDYFVTIVPEDLPLVKPDGTVNCDSSLYEYCLVFKEINWYVLKLGGILGASTE